jgi:hypothetical protein
MKRLHDDDQRVAAARSAMEATEAQMRALAAQEPPKPAELCAGVEQGPPKGVMGAEEGPLIPMV